jgi:hypothetical protein
MLGRLSRWCLIVELAVATVIWIWLWVPTMLLALGTPLWMDLISDFERAALIVGQLAYWPVLFLAFGYFKSDPGEFRWEFEAPWLLPIAIILLLLMLVLLNLTIRPNSGYTRGILVQLVLVGVPTVHLLVVAIGGKLANSAMHADAPAARR